MALAKLLRLPPHPPYVNDSHARVTGLKKYRINVVVPQGVPWSCDNLQTCSKIYSVLNYSIKPKPNQWGSSLPLVGQQLKFTSDVPVATCEHRYPAGHSFPLVVQTLNIPVVSLNGSPPPSLHPGIYACRSVTFKNVWKKLTTNSTIILTIELCTKVIGQPIAAIIYVLSTSSRSSIIVPPAYRCDARRSRCRRWRFIFARLTWKAWSWTCYNSTYTVNILGNAKLLLVGQQPYRKPSNVQVYPRGQFEIVVVVEVPAHT